MTKNTKRYINPEFHFTKHLKTRLFRHQQIHNSSFSCRDVAQKKMQKEKIESPWNAVVLTPQNKVLCMPKKLLHSFWRGWKNRVSRRICLLIVWFALCLPDKSLQSGKSWTWVLLDAVEIGQVHPPDLLMHYWGPYIVASFTRTILDWLWKC